MLKQRAYQREFNVRNPPSESMICRLIGRFQQTGSVHELRRSERQRSALTEYNNERLLNSTEE